MYFFFLFWKKKQLSHFFVEIRSQFKKKQFNVGFFFVNCWVLWCMVIIKIVEHVWIDVIDQKPNHCLNQQLHTKLFAFASFRYQKTVKAIFVYVCWQVDLQITVLKQWKMVSFQVEWWMDWRKIAIKKYQSYTLFSWNNSLFFIYCFILAMICHVCTNIKWYTMEIWYSLLFPNFPRKLHWF